MKRRLLFFVLLLVAVVVFLSSCEDGVFGSKLVARGYINVYTLGAKGLSGTFVRFPVSSKTISDAEFRKMESQFAGTNIVGIEFLGIEAITGVFSFADETSLTDLVFPASVKVIGDNAFRSSTNLTNIVFKGEVPPSVSETAFPDTFSSECDFIVPRVSLDSYREVGALAPWLADGKNGYLRYPVTVNFDYNLGKYPKLTTPVRGTSVSTVISGSDPSEGFSSPSSLGWTFDGYYLESDAKVTTFTDAEGVFETDVDNYLGGGKMIANADEITVYAHWTENEYTLTLEKTTGTVFGETTSTTLKYTENYLLSDEGLRKIGFCVAGWRTTTTDGAGTYYPIGTEVSKLCADNGGSVSLYAVWVTKEFFDYTVEYWFMNTSGTDYERDDSLTLHLSARPYTTISAETPNVTGFTYNAAISTQTNILSQDLYMVLTVRYDRNQYAIRWLNGDNQVVTTTNVYYETMPTYTDLTVPTKSETAQWNYTFNGTWLPAIVPATFDTSYTAQFDSHLQKYTVSVLVNDSEYGSVSDTSVTDVEYGTEIVVSGTSLIISDTNMYKTVIAVPSSTTTDYTYSFDRWIGSTSVLTDTDITANFKRSNNPMVTTPSALYMDCTLYIYYAYRREHDGARPDTYSTSIKYNDTHVNIGTGAYAPTFEGHTLEGFYLNTECTGYMIMDSSGNLKPNIAGYTNAEGKWIKTDGGVVKFYAKWGLLI